MTERERLVKELGSIIGYRRLDDNIDSITDFILKDRKRIVEPLINELIRLKDLICDEDIEIIDEVLNELLRQCNDK